MVRSEGSPRAVSMRNVVRHLAAAPFVRVQQSPLFCCRHDRVHLAVPRSVVVRDGLRQHVGEEQHRLMFGAAAALAREDGYVSSLLYACNEIVRRVSSLR